jgi:hypothetical protein
MYTCNRISPLFILVHYNKAICYGTQSPHCNEMGSKPRNKIYVRTNQLSHNKALAESTCSIYKTSMY